MVSIEAWVDLVKGNLKDLLYSCEMRHAAYQKFMVATLSPEVLRQGDPVGNQSKSLSATYTRACGDLEKIRKDGWDLRSAVLNNPDFLTYEEYLADVRCLQRRYAAAVERHTQQNLDLSFLEEVTDDMGAPWEKRYAFGLVGLSSENREELNFIRKGQFSAHSTYLQL